MNYIIRINPKCLPVFSECPAELSVERAQDIIGGTFRLHTPHAMLVAKYRDLRIVCGKAAKAQGMPHNEFATILGHVLGGNIYGTAIIIRTENGLLLPLSAAELQDVRDMIEELYEVTVREEK